LDNQNKEKAGSLAKLQELKFFYAYPCLEASSTNPNGGNWWI